MSDDDFVLADFGDDTGDDRAFLNLSKDDCASRSCIMELMTERKTGKRAPAPAAPIHRDGLAAVG